MKLENLKILRNLNINVPKFIGLSEINKDTLLDNLKNIFKDKKIAIRSSPEYSMPGILKTELNVPLTENLFIEKYNSVYNSYFSTISKLVYKKYDYNIPKNPEIIFQEMVNIKSNGIFYTKNPETKKGYSYTYINARDKLSVDGENSNSILPKSKLKELCKIGQLLEEYFNYPQDIEYVISTDNDLWILQTRNIVFNNKIENYPKINLKNYTEFSNGKGLVKGISKGILTKVKLKVPYILYVNTFIVNLDLLTSQCKGIIVDNGNMLCHAAIICRQNNIPCIQYNNINKILNKNIKIDGKSGKIYVKNLIS